MTDRYKGVVVAFERDIRDDDAKALLAAIRQLRGVAAVEPQIAGFNDHMVTMRVDQQWREALLLLLERGPAIRALPNPAVVLT